MRPVTIFSGFRVSIDDLNKMKELNDKFDYYLDTNTYDSYYVGEIIVTCSSNQMIDIELLRDWSTLDKVRNVRFLLSRITGKYDALPKIYILF